MFLALEEYVDLRPRVNFGTDLRLHESCSGYLRRSETVLILKVVALLTVVVLVQTAVTLGKEV